MDDQDIIREFLIESGENLGQLDNQMLELEKRPTDAQLLASIFRTVHTVKGTCGFLGFGQLERITHEAETILSQLRNGERELTTELVTLVLDVVDATRAILALIESTGGEGPEAYGELIERLRAAAAMEASTATKIPEAKIAETAAPVPSDAPESMNGESVVGDSAIRVDVRLLDKLMNLVGELVLARNQIAQGQMADSGGTSGGASLEAAAQRLNLITTELQEGVMRTRMQPIGVVWNKMPRVVRDLARSLDKQIRLEMEGADTELDRTIIEAIKDPLTHLVRNCCDHAIERPQDRVRAGKPAEGRVLLRAFHEGGQVNIEIIDDGQGMDPEKLKRVATDKGIITAQQASAMTDREALGLIFRPGFSTAPAVTNVSGRGVGMDVVRTNIERIGGQVDITSRKGEGTTLRLKIPLTLAIIPGLIVTAGGERFAIPQVSLVELLRLEGEAGMRQIETVYGAQVYRRRGGLLPIAHLTEILLLGEQTAKDESASIVVLQAEDRQFGLVVDAIHDTEEIVVKPLDKLLKGVEVYSGATIMGDGRVALILDVTGLAKRSGVVDHQAERSLADNGASSEREAAVASERLLLFAAPPFARLAVPLDRVARLEEFDSSVVEQAGRGRVVQYRGGLLPLIDLGAVFEGIATPTPRRKDKLAVVVFEEGDRQVGIEVEEVLDITEEAVTVRQSSQSAGLLGSAVVGGRVADFLDLHYVWERVAGNSISQSVERLNAAVASTEEEPARV